MSNPIRSDWLLNKNDQRISAAIGLYCEENYLFIKMHWLFNFKALLSIG